MSCAVAQGYLNFIGKSQRSFAKIEDFDLTIDRYHPHQFKAMTQNDSL